MSKKEGLSAADLAGLPKGTIPTCPCCEKDALTVSMSNARPTKVWCGECAHSEFLETHAPAKAEPHATKATHKA